MFAAKVETAISTETHLGYMLCSLASLSATSNRITVVNSENNFNPHYKHHSLNGVQINNQSLL